MLSQYIKRPMDSRFRGNDAENSRFFAGAPCKKDKNRLQWLRSTIPGVANGVSAKIV